MTGHFLVLQDEDCEEGEIKESSEGELSDDNEDAEGDARARIEQTPHIGNCRFFMRGSCTWGMNCRFLHPGVNDKGEALYLITALLYCFNAFSVVSDQPDE